jgi:hypothetical protein
MRRAALAGWAALGGATVEGVVDMVSICAYALFRLKKRRDAPISAMFRV